MADFKDDPVNFAMIPQTVSALGGASSRFSFGLIKNTGLYATRSSSIVLSTAVLIINPIDFSVSDAPEEITMSMKKQRVY